MKLYVLTLLGPAIFAPAYAGTKGTNKQVAALWYEAFDKHDASILDKALSTWHSEDWMTGLQQLGVFEK